jgi:hypothetical protein
MLPTCGIGKWGTPAGRFARLSGGALPTGYACMTSHGGCSSCGFGSGRGARRPRMQMGIPLRTKYAARTGATESPGATTHAQGGNASLASAKMVSVPHSSATNRASRRRCASGLMPPNQYFPCRPYWSPFQPALPGS